MSDERIIQPAPTEHSHIRVDDGIRPPTLVPRNQCLKHLATAQDRILLEAERRGWLPLRLARITLQKADREELLQYAARDLLEHTDNTDNQEAATSYAVAGAPASVAPTTAMWQEPAAKRTERIEKNHAALLAGRTLIDQATTQLYADHPVNILLRQAIDELAKVELG